MTDKSEWLQEECWKVHFLEHHWRDVIKTKQFCEISFYTNQSALITLNRSKFAK